MWLQTSLLLLAQTFQNFAIHVWEFAKCRSQLTQKAFGLAPSSINSLFMFAVICPNQRQQYSTNYANSIGHIINSKLQSNLIVHQPQDVWIMNISEQMTYFLPPDDAFCAIRWFYFQPGDLLILNLVHVDAPHSVLELNNLQAIQISPRSFAFTKIHFRLRCPEQVHPNVILLTWEVSGFLGFLLPRFWLLVVLVSQFVGSLVSKFFGPSFTDSFFHFIFSGSCWFHIKDFQEIVKRIFIVFRCPPFRKYA